MTYTTIRTGTHIRVQRDQTLPVRQDWVVSATSQADYWITVGYTTRFSLATSEHVQKILDSQLVRMDPIFRKLK